MHIHMYIYRGGIEGYIYIYIYIHIYIYRGYTLLRVLVSPRLKFYENLTLAMDDALWVISEPWSTKTSLGSLYGPPPLSSQQKSHLGPFAENLVFKDLFGLMFAWKRLSPSPQTLNPQP